MLRFRDVLRLDIRSEAQYRKYLHYSTGVDFVSDPLGKLWTRCCRVTIPAGTGTGRLDTRWVYVNLYNILEVRNYALRKPCLVLLKLLAYSDSADVQLNVEFHKRYPDGRFIAFEKVGRYDVSGDWSYIQEYCLVPYHAAQFNIGLHPYVVSSPAEDVHLYIASIVVELVQNPSDDLLEALGYSTVEEGVVTEPAAGSTLVSFTPPANQVWKIKRIVVDADESNIFEVYWGSARLLRRAGNFEIRDLITVLGDGSTAIEVKNVNAGGTGVEYRAYIHAVRLM